MINIGIQLEYEFIEFLNNKRYGNFNPKWKKHLKRMFPSIKDTDLIKAYKHGDPQGKPDIVIVANDSTIYLSIKSGRNPSMHQEWFPSWWNFMTALGLSEETKQIISLYQYGTSTYFKESGVPLTKTQLTEKYGDLIKKANEEINKERIIKNVAYRAVVAGATRGKDKIDFLYYGNISKGFLVSVDQIYESALSRKEISSEFIHFGEFTYQPSGRSRDRKDYKYARIHWPILTRLFYESLDDDNFLKRKDPNEFIKYSKHDKEPTIPLRKIDKEMPKSAPSKAPWYGYLFPLMAVAVFVYLWIEKGR